MNLQEANLLENGCYHCNMHVFNNRSCMDMKNNKAYIYQKVHAHANFLVGLWKKLRIWHGIFQDFEKNTCLAY